MTQLVTCSCLTRESIQQTFYQTATLKWQLNKQEMTRWEILFKECKTDEKSAEMYTFLKCVLIQNLTVRI